jgi:hypothetical protein
MAKKNRKNVRPLSPVRFRKLEPDELRERHKTRDREIQEILSEARSLAVGPEEDRQRLFLLVLRVSQLHPPFARELFQTLKHTVRAGRSIQSLIGQMSKAKGRRSK